MLRKFSEDKILDNQRLFSLSNKEKKFLEQLLNFSKGKKLNYISFKREFKNLQRFILNRYHNEKNLIHIRKVFMDINKKLYTHCILKKGVNIIQEKNLNNFLNYYFEYPNENLRNMISYILSVFRKNFSKIIFSFNRYKIDFFKILFSLRNEKWKIFKKNFNFICFKKNRENLSECILFDSTVKYYMNFFFK